MAGGVFVSSVHVVKFESLVRESRTPSSEGSFRKHPSTDANNWWGALFSGDCLKNLYNQAWDNQEAGRFFSLWFYYKFNRLIRNLN